MTTQAKPRSGSKSQAQAQPQQPQQKHAQQQSSRAELMRERLDSMMTSLENRSEQLDTLLMDSGVDKKKFLAVARMALGNNPDLVECRADTVVKAFMQCALDGLRPDGTQAAIVPRTMNYGKADEYKVSVYQPMYQGYLNIAYASKNFRMIEAQVVYDGDHFKFQLGDGAFIHHIPQQDAVAARNVIAAYARAETVNGGVFREVMLKADLEKLRAASKATKGPRKEWGEQMDRKGPLRRMWKFLPKNEAMERVAAHDDEHTYEGDFLAVGEAPRPRLTAGFAPPPPIEPEEEEQGQDDDAEGEGQGQGDDGGEPGAGEQGGDGEAAVQDAGGPAGPSTGSGELPLGDPGAEVEDDEVVLGWATAFNQTVEHLKNEDQLNRALDEPLNVRRYTRLRNISPGIAEALDRSIADKRKALKKGSANG